MVLITIVNGVYKPTYNWGAPPCREFYQTTFFVGYQAATNTQKDGSCWKNIGLKPIINYDPMLLEKSSHCSLGNQFPCWKIPQLQFNAFYSLKRSHV